MNDHQLLCFLTVSRTLNFTTAARELYCTQPALSYQIRSLEKELDLALFERSTTRVALTECSAARQTQPSICPLGRCSRRSSAPPSCTTPFT